MVFVMIAVGVLVAAVLQELVLDRIRLRRGAAAPERRQPASMASTRSSGT